MCVIPCYQNSQRHQFWYIHILSSKTNTGRVFFVFFLWKVWGPWKQITTSKNTLTNMWKHPEPPPSVPWKSSNYNIRNKQKRTHKYHVPVLYVPRTRCSPYWIVPVLDFLVLYRSRSGSVPYWIVGGTGCLGVLDFWGYWMFTGTGFVQAPDLLGYRMF